MLGDIVIIGATPTDLVLSTSDPVTSVGDWAHARFSSRGLDPRGVLESMPFLAEPGANAHYAPARHLPDFDLSHPAHVRIGQDLLDRAAPASSDAEHGLRLLATASTHEAGHAVDDSIRGMRSIQGEAGTVAEHVADVLGMAASDTITDRAPLVPGRVGRTAPRHASQYISTQLDRGGAHVNTVFLNDAALRAQELIGTDQLGAVYLDALEHTPRRPKISEFAHETVRSAARLHGPGSAQVAALDQAWTGVGLTRELRETGAKLRTRRGVIAAIPADLRHAKPAARVKIGVRVAVPVLLAGGAAAGVAMLVGRRGDT